MARGKHVVQIRKPRPFPYPDHLQAHWEESSAITSPTLLSVCLCASLPAGSHTRPPFPVLSAMAGHNESSRALFRMCTFTADRPPPMCRIR